MECESFTGNPGVSESVAIEAFVEIGKTDFECQLIIIV
jgi:hypothetical protein